MRSGLRRSKIECIHALSVPKTALLATSVKKGRAHRAEGSRDRRDSLHYHMML